ncbi:recombinase family protein [Gordonia polyisoprenivorans]|uniref:recombinase family protein n=1 Tax=Gordonia polyisoprenivorans TaxID=84595 RepID=UPI001B8C18F4|nr:recombinase family protein [Gordonia polyisoprenivorans]QUD85273.1 recombinase family protein [Gordonia polyisoprenivorans]
MPTTDPGAQPGMLLGYARESSDSPALDEQIDLLIDNGVDPERVYSDHSRHDSPTAHRPGLDALLGYARPGDTVLVVGMDRLGRSTPELLSTVRTLDDRNIGVRSIRERLRTDDDVGATLVGVLASLAVVNDEAARTRQRTQPRPTRHSGSSPLGRPRVLTDEQVELAQRMRDNGDPVPTIATTLGVSRATLYRTLAEKRTTR